MPIDIASGIVNIQFNDITIPGKVDLVWDRFYSTAYIEQSAKPFGQGWTNRFFSTLTQKDNGFEFVTPSGIAEFISDTENAVAQGRRATNYGAFLEVFQESRRYIVQHWDVETGEIERYCFKPGPAGEPWRLSSIEDVTGQTLDIAWKADGRLAGIRQHLEKRTLILSYTPTGYIDAIVFQASNGEQQVLAKYEYNTTGQLIAAYDAADNADHYEYDEQGRLTREIVKDGGVFTYKYDNKGRCIKSSGLDRYDEKNLRFLDAAGITELTNSYGHTFYYHHLPSGQIVREINPHGNEKITEYDEYGRITTKTDATGAVTTYSYDEHGNRSSITDALGNCYHFTYNEHHLPLSMIDPMDQNWWRIYDNDNRLTSTIDPLRNRWSLHYDSDGNIYEITNPLGVRKYQKFTNGVVDTISDWGGNVTRFEHDNLGRVVQRQSPLGETTQFRYNALGNPVEATLPNGATLNASYDNAGNLTSFTDANGCTTRFRYGACRRLLEHIDPVGGILRYVWGSEPGRLEQIINERGETYYFFRDDTGRIIREISFDGAERRFVYDEEGFAIAHTNANGETIAIQRDSLHQIIRLNLPDGEQLSYTYDPVGNLVSAVNTDTSISFERDPLGRIIKEIQGEHWVKSRYDALGNLTHTSTSLSHWVDYEIDTNGFIKRLTTLDNQSLEFNRNPNGQETVRVMPGGLLMEQRHDNLGQLIEQRIGPGRLDNDGTSTLPQHNEIIRRNFEYDRNGSLISIIDGRWGRTDYDYDPAERLLQAICDQRASEFFSYDSTGNIIQNNYNGSQENFIYGPGNRLLQKGQTHYEYDPEGRCIKKIEEFDSDNPKTWLYEWNALDQLKSVKRPDGDIWHYKYDCLARRVEKTGPDKSFFFIWDKDVLIHEATEKKPVSSWIFDIYSFAPLVTIQNSCVYSVINDHLGTPKEIIDSNGAVVWAINQKAWGETLNEYSSINNAVECPIRFQGQWMDSESELHYNRFRYYDPKDARYISPDLIRLEGGRNFYTYAQNPIRRIDPFGLQPIPVRPADLSGGPHAPDRTMNQVMGRAARSGNPQGQWLSQDAAIRAAAQYDPARGGVQVVPIAPGDGQVVHHPVMSYPPRPGETPVVHDGIPMSRGGPLVVPATAAVLIPSGGEIHTFPIDETHPQHDDCV